MRSVQPSQELDRVCRLPRRTWTEPQRAALVQRLTSALKAPQGTQTLRPLQAVALAEIAMWRGAFCPLPTGKGKTLLMLLAPRILPAIERPMFLMPAHLVTKTEEEEREYRAHWNLPPFRRIESYQTISRVGAARLLDSYCPDMIVADEAHMLKNPRAAVTRRVVRYLKEHPGTVFVPMTGTPTGKSLREFAHLLALALPRTNPTPSTYLDLDEWCRALDVDIPEHKRLAPGALARLGPGNEVRSIFQSRLRDTPGVVMSEEPPLPIPLIVTSHVVPLDAAQESAFAKLRADWVTPDDQMAEDGPSVWRHARELSTGFYSVWTPRPPEPWKEARRAWASMCRDILAHNKRDIDSEEQLRQHVLAHPRDYDGAHAILSKWLETEPTFIPNPVPYWISDTAIDWIVEWSRGTPGWIWTDRPCVGERLAARGLPYYGEEGVDQRTGIRSKNHDAARGSAVLARKANDSGLNLQFMARNLVIDVPAGAIEMEQMVARTHRPGQGAPAVTFDFSFGSIEDVTAFWRAYERSIYAQEITGQPMKICHADLDAVLNVETARSWKEPRWQKTK